jgi:RimJ/RimL family protein N-acetyltransferase
VSTGLLESRCWSAEDLSLASPLRGDPRLTALIGGPFTDDAAAQRLSFEIARESRDRMEYWAIFLRKYGESAGWARVSPYDADRRVQGLVARLRSITAPAS